MRDNSGRLDIIALEHEPIDKKSIEKGVVSNSSDVAYHIGSLVKKLTNRLADSHNAEVDGIYIPVKAPLLYSKRYRIEKQYDTNTTITSNGLTALRQEAQSKRIEGKTIYSITNEEYALDDDTIRNPENKSCKKIEANFLVSYASNNIRKGIDSYVDALSPSIKKCGETLAPTAIAQAVTTKEDRSAGCAVINFGATSTTVAVYQDGYLRNVASIPLGGNHITADLTHLNLTINEAEQLKCKAGSPIAPTEDKQYKIGNRAGEVSKTINQSQISTIVRSRIEEIVLLCMNEIDRSGYIDRLEHGIIITGGGSLMNDITTYMEQLTNKAVRIGSYLPYLTDQSAERFNETEHTLLIGTLLLATEPCTHDKVVQQTPPPVEHKKEKEKKKKGSGFMDFFTGRNDSITDE